MLITIENIKGFSTLDENGMLENIGQLHAQRDYVIEQKNNMIKHKGEILSKATLSEYNYELEQMNFHIEHLSNLIELTSICGSSKFDTSKLFCNSNEIVMH